MTQPLSFGPLQPVKREDISATFRVQIYPTFDCVKVGLIWHADIGDKKIRTLSMKYIEATVSEEVFINSHSC